MTEEQKSGILASLPDRICDVLKPWSERLPDQPALVESGGSWSYRQLDSTVAETRQWLINSGVRPGDRVMIVCENSRALVAVLLAVAGIDAWPVLVNASLSASEVEKIRSHCSPRRVIHTTSVSPHATQLARLDNATIEEVGNLGQIGISPLNEDAVPEPLSDDVANNVAAMIYTSGTTGVPRGVMLTHRNLLFIAAVSAKIRDLTPKDHLYGVLPMSHAVGLSVVLLGSLLSGATLYLTPRFDPITARVALERDQITVLLGAPSMFVQFLQYAKLRALKALEFPALRILASASAPLHPTVKSSVETFFGLVLHNGYGVTECSPTIAQTRPEEPRSDISVGPILPEVQIQLVGPQGKPVPPGEVGELWVRGPNVMKGYYRAPEETAAAINAGGWFNTRDLARLEAGNLFIVGRTKELIVRHGFNVYPAEVEAVLNSHPAVVQSAVIGRSVDGDEEIVAFVQLVAQTSVTSTDLSEYGARHLAPYKRPSQILIVSTMPTTATGKIVKGELARIAETSQVC
jgi:long-chain acyl-CoA synthetase